MKYNLSDFNQFNGEEIVFIRAFIAAGSPKIKENEGIDVEFKINGSDVNFKDFVKLFVEHYDTETKIEAAKMLVANSNFAGINEFNDKINRMQRELSNMLAEKLSSVLNLDGETIDRIVKDY